MTRKTLLVLAASRYQLPIIEKARDLGYRVLTLDNASDNPGHALADASFCIDTTDVESVLAVAREEAINGVIAACTDVAVPTAAAIAQTLGLPGVPVAAAHILCDKNRFRAFLAEQDWPTPEARQVDKDTALPASFFDQPRILKPDTASGSKGVRILGSLAEYQAQLDATLGFSRNGRGVLETFIDGWQITCEGLLIQGQIAFAVITDRQTVPPPHVATRGHRIPSRLPALPQERVLDLLARLWTRLGVTDGPFDSDLVIADDEIYLLEASPRIGGNSLTRLLKTACGIDLVACGLRQAMGERIALPASLDRTPTGLLILGAETPGRLHYDPNLVTELRGLPWVEHLSIDHPPGTAVSAFHDGRHRIGEVMVRGKDPDDVDRRLLEIKADLAIETRT